MANFRCVISHHGVACAATHSVVRISLYVPCTIIPGWGSRGSSSIHRLSSLVAVGRALRAEIVLAAGEAWHISRMPQDGNTDTSSDADKTKNSYRKSTASPPDLTHSASQSASQPASLRQPRFTSQVGDWLARLNGGRSNDASLSCNWFAVYQNAGLSVMPISLTPCILRGLGIYTSTTFESRAFLCTGPQIDKWTGQFDHHDTSPLPEGHDKIVKIVFQEIGAGVSG